MIEYWLLKKQLGGWTKVSWWSEEEKDKALTSYGNMVKSGGYAVRLVSVNMELEHLLDEMLPEPKGEVEPVEAAPVKSGWGATPTAGAWGQPMTNQPIKSEGPSNHGLAGSVWMVHYVLKKKTRVPASEVESLMAQGYERGSPRTVL